MRESRGSVSSSSCGTRVCEDGRRDVDIRDMITIGGSNGEGFRERTTWYRDSINCWCLIRTVNTHRCPDKNAMERSFGLTESLNFQGCLK